ncbi:AMP dependent ligase/synthetase [Penicillium malachiteum]|nr:AMP dependent ligase/synthetase [Penicillium malachiteum]
MAVSDHKESCWRRGGDDFIGQRLLPQVIDYHAHENPTHIFASVPRTENVADGFRDIDMKTLATAVDAMAWWLDDRSKEISGEKVLGYVGVPDIRYPIIFFAAIKAGWAVISQNIFS